MGGGGGFTERTKDKEKEGVDKSPGPMQTETNRV